MNSVRTILEIWGFNQDHYVMSLQGPTLILSMAGQEKITKAQREKLEQAGVAILG